MVPGLEKNGFGPGSNYSYPRGVAQVLALIAFTLEPAVALVPSPFAWLPLMPLAAYAAVGLRRGRGLPAVPAGFDRNGGSGPKVDTAMDTNRPAGARAVPAGGGLSVERGGGSGGGRVTSRRGSRP